MSDEEKTEHEQKMADAKEEIQELEEDPPEKLEDWPDGQAKYETFGGAEGDRSYDEGPEAKLGPDSVRHHEDGSVEVGGEQVDDPDEYKGEPIPGGPDRPGRRRATRTSSGSRGRGRRRRSTTARELAGGRLPLSGGGRPPGPTGPDAASAPRSSTSFMNSASASAARAYEPRVEQRRERGAQHEQRAAQAGTTTQRRRCSMPSAIAWPACESG